jgi:hypothetical protein
MPLATAPKPKQYFQQLAQLTSKADTPRPELTEAAAYTRR